MVAFLVIAGAAFFAGRSAKDDSQPVAGTFVLTDEDLDVVGETCAGSGGFSDVTEGLAVVVKDEAGKVLATSRLRSGEVVEDGDACSFPFTVEVPRADFYTFEVGNRGDQTYSHEDLRRQGWFVGFTLGSP